MGQCMSRKSVTVFASAVVLHQKGLHSNNMTKHILSPEDESKPPIKKSSTKGVSTSFGFRKRPATAPSPTIQSNNPTADAIDNNGNTSGRAVPPHRLPPPKKEAQATTKVSRFGFREPNANRLNRVADINTNPPTRIEYTANNVNTNAKERDKIEKEIKAKVEMHQRQLLSDSNKNVRPLGKYTLQTNQLPKPMPIKLLESKTAKTLANNNRKQHVRTSGDESSSFTEDSGVGSHCGDKIRQLDKSPLSRRLRYNKLPKPRTLEVVVNVNTFDVRDMDHDTSLPTLPALPTLMNTYSGHFQHRPNSGFVRDRAIEYQRNVIDKKDSRKESVRRNSLTSSEASSLYEDEKPPYKRNEKIAKFIKQKPSSPIEPSSSDDQIWSCHVGEAMAEESSSVCMSSSDESKDKVTMMMEASIESLISAKAHNRLSLVDPQFAAIAAANVSATLIEDEPSPVDSIVCSYSEINDSTVHLDNDAKMNKSPSSSNSKDVNEKTTASSPSSPTNASNSLSLSDGRDDFLIDDEIADQPALLFDDTLTNSNQASEATPTIVDSTPRPSRRILASYESSPLSLRNRKLLRARTVSLDTLSPCESIASDDCMMDYDLSSGVEDANDRTEINGHYNLDDVELRTIDLKVNETIRDWSSLLSTCDTTKRLSLRSARLLKSRDGTPTSSVPESPRLDAVKKTSVSQSPLRLSSRSSTGTGYESDDSAVVRLDRSQHCAMQQDVMGIKTLLLKLKRVLHEPATEDYVLKSETRNSLKENGFFNGFGSDSDRDAEEQEAGEEMDNLRRQVVFLQGQLEDTERVAQNLREEMVNLTMAYQSSQSAPVSISSTSTTTPTASARVETCNAATQTERIRPISAGPTLFQGAANDLNTGSLVSVRQTLPLPSTSTRRSRHTQQNQSTPTPSSLQHSTPTKNTSSSSLPSPSRLWRMPGEPPTPSAIPRRSSSRSRISNIPLTTTSTTTTT